MTTKRHLLLLLALVASLVAPAPALADDEPRPSEQNAAVVVNERNDSSLFDFAFSIRRVAGDVVDQQNVALAYSSCERCRSVAIAIQIVLVSSTPSTVTPQNVAVAVNESCTLCETFASAYQFVIGGDGPLFFTNEGKRELRRIVREIRRLDDPDLTLDEIRARLDALIARLRVVLQTQLVPKRGHGNAGDDEEDDDVDERARGDPDEEEPAATTQTETETQPAETAPTDTTATEPAETTPTATEPTPTATDTTQTETVPTTP